MDGMGCSASVVNMDAMALTERTEAEDAALSQCIPLSVRDTKAARPSTEKEAHATHESWQPPETRTIVTGEAVPSSIGNDTWDDWDEDVAESHMVNEGRILRPSQYCAARICSGVLGGNDFEARLDAALR